jgi:hydroxymethylpyrimidine pyrophosphatase-like HAD family hydrolase
MQDILDWISRIGLSNIVWITDLDRTVVDNDRNTGKVFVPPDLEGVCRRLDDVTAGFYIVTGRSLNTVDAVFFPNTHFKISAEYHNVQRFDPDAQPSYAPAIPWGAVDDLFIDLANTHPDLNLKVMGYLRAFQYHRVPENDQQALKEFLQPRLEAMVAKLNAIPGAPAVELVDFDSSFDIVPVGTSKGPAVHDIMAFAEVQNGRSLVPIYFGDNPGDIDAGRATQAHGGIFAAVGDDPEVCAAADFVLPDTATARALFAKASAMGNAPAPRLPRLNP